MNKKDTNIILVILLLVVLGLCFLIFITSYNKNINLIDYKAVEDYKKRDITATICLEDDNIRITGEGATTRNNIVTIGKEGVYEISGTLSKGQIIVQAPFTSEVELRLIGVKITSMENPPINCRSAKNLIITLVENTENYLIDSENYFYEDTLNEEPNATLFSKSDMRIRGEGFLVIDSKYMHGISSKDNLIIETGNIKVSSIGDGIRGTDSITILNGNFDVKCGGDGIQSSNIQNSNLGYIVIENGNFNIEASGDGIQAETDLLIYDGIYNIKTQGVPFGGADSQKGIKSNRLIEIRNGNFVLNTLDDAIHSNKDFKIDNAIMEIYTLDDALHSEGMLIINDGDIDIKESFEGLEGAKISILGGNININSANDGISAVGNDKPRFDMLGGYIYCLAKDDGIDVNNNGEMCMRGGTLIVDTSTSAVMGGPIDFIGDFYMYGGKLLGIGRKSNVQFPERESTVPTFVYYFDSKLNGENKITIVKEDGTELVSYTGMFMSSTYIQFASEELNIGENYKIILGNGSVKEIKLTDINTIKADSNMQKEVNEWLERKIIVK